MARAATSGRLPAHVRLGTPSPEGFPRSPPASAVARCATQEIVLERYVFARSRGCAQLPLRSVLCPLRPRQPPTKIFVSKLAVPACPRLARIVSLRRNAMETR